MKQQIVILLLAAICSAQFLYPRDPTGCTIQQTTGSDADKKNYFFDQKCEYCADYCKQCTEWNKCTQCSDYYSPQATTTGSYPKCLPCFSTGTVPTTGSAYGTGEGVKTCCLMQDSVTQALSFHAATCDSANDYFLYGSYCVQILNCKTQTPQYTKCLECKDGFYMNLDITAAPNDQCLACSTYQWNNVNDGNSLTQASICSQCRELIQCTVCKDGFYLKTDYNRNVYEKTIIQFASVCAACQDPNCKLCPEGGFCTTCKDGYYWNPLSLRCYLCGHDPSNQYQKINQKFVQSNIMTDDSKKFNQNACNDKTLNLDTYTQCKDWFAFQFSVYGCNTCSYDSGNNKVKCNTCQTGYTSYTTADGTQTYCTRTSQTDSNFQNAYCYVYTGSQTCTPPAAGFQSLDLFKTNLASDQDLNIVVSGNIVVGSIGLLGTYDVPLFTFKNPSECGDKAGLQVLSAKATLIAPDQTYVDSNKATISPVTRTYYYYHCASCNNGLATLPILDTTSPTTGKIIPLVAFATTLQQNQCDFCQTLIQADDVAANVADFTSTQYQFVYRCDYMGKGLSTNNYPNKQYKITLCGDTYSLPQAASTQFGQYRAPLRKLNHDQEMYLVNSKYGNTCVKNTKLCKLILGDNTYLPTDYDNTAKFKCDTCYDGYSKSTTTFECKKCPADGDVACTKCEATYTGTVPNCLNCVTGINRGFYTDTTKVNYYLAAGACKACDANCLTCDATGCSACQAGYFQDANKACTKCNTNNCMQCSDANTCTKCFSTFALISQTKLCQSCDTGCLACNGDQRKTCTVCASGYYLDTGKCHPKRYACLEYDQNGGKCSKCQYGYRINEDGWCMQCLSIEGGFYNCPLSCTFDSQFSNIGKSSNTPKSVLRNLADLLEDEQL